MKKTLLILMALASLTMAGSAATSNVDYEITGVTRDFLKFIHIKGFVTNRETVPIKYVRVNGAGYNIRHDMIDHGSSFAVGSMALEPGQRAFFDVVLQDKDGNEITQYDLYVD